MDLIQTLMESVAAQIAGKTLSRRQRRGLDIALTLELSRSGHHSWKIPSQSGGKLYYVNDRGGCTCPDEPEGEVCKHEFATICLAACVETLQHRLLMDVADWRNATDTPAELIEALVLAYADLLAAGENYQPPPEGLLYSLEIEVVGALYADMPRPWVAQLLGFCPQYEFRRKFISGQRDYRHASKSGFRGIHQYYHLPDGLFEVCEVLDWEKSRRYFARVENLTLTEVDQAEVIATITGEKHGKTERTEAE